MKYFMQDSEQRNNSTLGKIASAEVNVISDALQMVAKNHDDIIAGGQGLINSANKNINISTSEYTKNVAQAGKKSLFKGIVIGSIVAATTVLLTPFGIAGIAGAALISLTLSSAFVVGTAMYEEKQAREAKEKQEAKVKIEQDLVKSPLKEKDGINQNLSKDDNVKVNELAKKDLEEKSQKVSKENNDKKQGGVKEFFARTSKLFAASFGILVVAALSIAAAVAIGVVLTPILGPIGAGVAAACTSATVGFGGKVGLSALAHSVNKVLVENDIIAGPEIQGKAIVKSIEHEKVVEPQKVVEHEKSQPLLVDNQHIIEEQKDIIKNQLTELESLKKQLDDIKGEVQKLSNPNSIDQINKSSLNSSEIPQGGNSKNENKDVLIENIKNEDQLKPRSKSELNNSESSKRESGNHVNKLNERRSSQNNQQGIIVL